jgi:hypothetical protein
MDWKQFAASLIGSLAWPSVAIVLMFICRKQWSTFSEGSRIDLAVV